MSVRAVLMIRLGVAVGVGSVAGFSGCKSESAAPAAPSATAAPAPSAAPPAPAPSVVAPSLETLETLGPWYRVVLDRGQGVEVSFLVAIPPSTDRPAHLFNMAKERIPVPHRWEGDEVTLPFPAYQTELRLRRAGSDLVGEWRRRSRVFGDESMAAHAAPVATADVAALHPVGGDAPSTGTRLAGVWRAAFADQGAGRFVISEGAGGVVEVAMQFEFTDAADLLMSGRRTREGLRMSSFDGTYAYAVVATVAADGQSLSGRWYAGPSMEDSFTATRDDQFALSPTIPLDEEITLPVAHEAAYAGKPLLIDIAASWCPPCQRAAPFLRALYQEHHPRGLEMITLLYEFTDDDDERRARAEAFRRAHGIPWEVRPVVGGLETFADSLPEALGLTMDNLKGLPVVMFVDRDGVIRAVHAGYVGPEQPAEHQRLAAAYQGHIARIIAASR